MENSNITIFDGTSDEIENTKNKVKSINEQSTDEEYPTAKAVYNELVNQDSNMNHKQDKFANVKISGGAPETRTDMAELHLDNHMASIYLNGDKESAITLYCGDFGTIDCQKEVIFRKDLSCGGTINATEGILVRPTKSITLLTTPDGNIKSDVVNVEYIDKEVEKEREKSNSLFANILKGRASNDTVNLTDVSPTAYNIEVKLKNKNMFDETAMLSVGHTENDEAYIFRNGAIYEDFNNTKSLLPNTVFKENTQYTFSYIAKQEKNTDSSALGYPRFEIHYTDGSRTLRQVTEEYSEITLVSLSGKTVSGIYYGYSQGGWFYVKKNSITLTEGVSSLKPYAPYITDFHNTNVTVYGKNLLPYPYASASATINGVTFTAKDDGTVTVNGTATADTLYFYVETANYTVRKGTYTLSGCPKGGSNTTYCQVFDSSDFMDTGEGVTRTYEQNINQNIFIKIFSGYTAENLIFTPQLEIGSAATARELYIAPTTYTPHEDGTVDGVTSIYPTTNILTDTEGVIIDCTYNRDINKAFAELESAIVALQAK